MNIQESQQGKDHDILLTLKADMRNGFETITTSIKRLEDGTFQKLDDHEIRIKHIEDRALRINLDGIAAVIDKSTVDTINDEWIAFKDKLKIYGILVVFFAGILAWIIQQGVTAYIRVHY